MILHGLARRSSKNMFFQPATLILHQNNKKNQENNINKTPSKMARLAWPKAKYGVILAVIIIIVVNLILYKDFFLSFFK